MSDIKPRALDESAATDENKHLEKQSQTIIDNWATEDGGFVDRPVLEKRLLRHLDFRFSILVSLPAARFGRGARQTDSAIRVGNHLYPQLH